MAQDQGEDEINFDGQSYKRTSMTLYVVATSIEVDRIFSKALNSEEYELRTMIGGQCEAEQGGVLVLGKGLGSNTFKWSLAPPDPPRQALHEAHVYHIDRDPEHDWPHGWFINSYISDDLIQVLVREFEAGRIEKLIFGVQFEGVYTDDFFEHRGPIYIKDERIKGSVQLIRTTSQAKTLGPPSA